ncbi:MAG: ABC transporter permease [Alistipes sp.]|jgi:putative ABC transport system permease protein|nr:ABC transporter permease [Alistipes sp.]
MFDLLGEILATMKRNKMRSFLTGFAVAWGIFMLIVLLGAGQGLQNGVKSEFEGRAINTVTLYPGRTSVPYKGYRSDRRIRFDERTVEFVRTNIPEVGYLSAGFSYSPTSVAYGKEYGTWQLYTGTQDHVKFEHMLFPKGRFINEVDMQQRRKVVVIGKTVVEALFKNGEEPLGKQIIIDGIAFQVIGVYEKPFGQSFSEPMYTPLSTALMLYDRGWGINQIEFTVEGIDTEEKADALSERVRAKMGAYLGFDPADTSAMYVRNSAKDAIQTFRIFGFINMFLWVIGFACIMAGIVGVANIMLVTVRERTREIGIRKAIGATPWSIIRSIIIESIVITTVAGYIGIVCGMGVTELISRGLNAGGGGGQMPFKDPTVGLGIVFSVLLLLVICGVVAGLIPALRATRIRPIEAMRAD